MIRGVQSHAKKRDYTPLKQFGIYSENKRRTDLEWSEINWRWVLNQQFAWIMCIVASRLIAGQLLFWVIHKVFGASSPILWLGLKIQALEWDCDTKIAVFMGLSRLVIDALQFIIVDHIVNRKKENREPLSMHVELNTDSPV